MIFKKMFFSRYLKKSLVDGPPPPDTGAGRSNYRDLPKSEKNSRQADSLAHTLCTQEYSA